jgi:hypothetical protein
MYARANPKATSTDIAEALKVKKSLVYSVIWKMKKGQVVKTTPVATPAAKPAAKPAIPVFKDTVTGTALLNARLINSIDHEARSKSIDVESLTVKQAMELYAKLDTLFGGAK